MTRSESKIRGAGVLSPRLTLLLVVAGVANSAPAQQPEVDAQQHVEQPAGLLNIASPTLGGRYFWTDELVFHDWRIQRNSLTDSCRLLDGDDYRRAWGDFDHCRAKLESLKQELGLPPLRGRVVIVLHGLVRSRGSMTPMCDYLKTCDEFSVINVSYASTRAGLGEHAAALARVIDNLQGAEEVSFVCHSLGNLVVRRYLADQARLPDEQRRRVRYGRIVMLGPPNQGADLAERFKNNQVFQVFWGASGEQLAAQWEQVEDQLAIPDCEFGIIAGGSGADSGLNPLLEGDDDFVVRVEETRLPGAADFVVVPALHSWLMKDARVQQYTLQFLRHGWFVSQGERRPIPAAQPAGQAAP